MNAHYTHNYLLSPTHPVTVTLIGVGGSGSHVLSGLVSLHQALRAFGHPGLQVCAYDGDEVSEANIGRGKFFPSDVGHNKATLLISRINRSFGLGWKAIPLMYTKELLDSLDKSSSTLSNLLITCVDSAKARIEISACYQRSIGSYLPPYHQPYYWMDYGNSQKTGQVVLGSLQDIKQPKRKEHLREDLPTVLELFPDILAHDTEAEQGPSCSLAQALSKQDLFINSILAQFGNDLLWKLFREAKISMQGAYINLTSFRVNPITF